MLRHGCPEIAACVTMTGAEFLKRVRKLAKERDLSYSWHPEMGKGSHGVLKLADRRTVVRNLKDELKTGTLHAMLKQLDLTTADLS
ncbi:MAG: type II toxin-antitoxin system HicA family toxin [Lamprobacter sp.]|uniref:type II toxin-antitoxin system HicA family toxin n=1 Tax=Lamprobacter sp. TaxID=3100796 RepID=UPI002B2608E5|nr:type II toxin-antitoxin system HicA family toxin [Lamprobacter sp.]MEA3641715.1 type II toxin-antitoxin system HicA family toxin [Lamprobacter sp.]